MCFNQGLNLDIWNPRRFGRNFFVMIIVKTRKELEEKRNILKKEHLFHGFVPTMGALHEGHLSLIRCSLSNDPVTVVSIFVNPTQFNDPEDLKKYPRNPEADMGLLEKVLRTGDLVFLPEENEVYPEPDSRVFDFGILDKVMEGKYRPGHFNGVAQVVSRLFNMVQPRNAYFGLKDFQQLIVIKEMVRMLKLPVNIVPCPIIREPDGLAMSSRNLRLGEKEREEAPLIFKTLKEAVSQKNKLPVNKVKEWVISRIEDNSSLKVEYFEIVHAETLQPVLSWDEPGDKQGCIAVWDGKVRLIDNISFSREKD